MTTHRDSTPLHPGYNINRVRMPIKPTTQQAMPQNKTPQSNRKFNAKWSFIIVGIVALLTLFPLLRDLLVGGDTQIPNLQAGTSQANACRYALCANVTINPGPHKPTPAASAPTTPAEPAEKRQPERQSGQALLKQDLSVNFRWSEPKKNGRSYALENGSRLYSGDEFTIQISAQTNQHLYLMHFDSHGQVHELMQLSGYSNNIQPGETRELPGKGRHFTLDANPGQETFHLLIANQPLQSVMQRYKKGLLQKSDISQVEYKGIFIEADQPTTNTKTQHIACRSNGDHCHYSFSIEHITGRR